MGIWDRLSRRLDELSEELLPDDVRDGVEGARALLERGQASAAVAALEAVLKRKPDHASALHLLGVARLRAGRPRQAADAFADAIRLRAGFAEAMVGLGEARLAMQDARAALLAFRDALAHAGGDRDTLAAVYRGLGRAHAALGDRDKAVRELRKALIEDPNDADTVAALAEALLAGGADADLDDARAPLEKACKAEGAPAAALVAFGRLELRGGRTAAAAAAFERALLGEPAPAIRAGALVGLGETLLALGDAPGAHRRLLEALAIAPSAALHMLVARAHLAVGSVEAALGAYAAAEQLGETAALPAALEVALAAGLAERAAELANRRLHQAPGDARAQAARGLALVAAGEPVLARAVLERAAAAGDTTHAPLALARLALGEAGGATRAVELARLVLARDPRDGRARRLLAEARRRELSAGDDDDSLAPDERADSHALLARVLAATRAAPELAELSGQAAYALDAYDRPLLLTVMGEFSSGKSTFVNALLGAEVAPVGITPTTATINILKYGREKRGRIVYRDDRERELDWDEVPRTLKALTPAEAARIRFVELLYPLDALERVSIVDTPGLNSILPEHEATAREFIAHADAVVWLFSAMQAGKASEREALEKIRGEGKRVLGVVNKIDQATEAERAQILAHLADQLGPLVEAFVPVSARRALDARARNDAAALDAAAWPALETALEQRFFAQARTIKRTAAHARLSAILGAARTRVDALAGEARAHTERLERAAGAARADALIFRRATVPGEARHLAERLSTTYRAAAREVLELVRPRRLPFGANTATAADRDYLIGLLERGLATLLEPTRQRVAVELGKTGEGAADAARAWHPAAGADVARQAADARTLVDARVFDRCRAYLRGYLRGGCVDEFFARALPKLELDEDSVYHALVRDAPDLQAELAAPLADAGETALAELAARLVELAGAADLRRFELEEALGGALAAFTTRVAAVGA